MTSRATEQSRANWLDGLSSSDAEVRRLSVEQLSLLTLEEALPYLGDCLGDSDWRVRKAVVARIQPFLDHPEVQEMLMQALADGEDAGRRNSAFEALVGAGERVLGRLTRELSNPDADVRKQIVDALAEIADPSSRRPLIEMTRDPDVNVRSAAVEALGHVAGTTEIQHLLELVRDEGEDVLVRLSSLRALTRMEVCVGVSSVGRALDHSLLRAAVFSLFAFSEDEAATEVLLKGLSVRTPSSREAAMGALLQRLGRVDDLEAERLRASIRGAAGSVDGFIEDCGTRLAAGNLETKLRTIQFLGLLDAASAIVPILECGADEALEGVALETLVGMGEGLVDALEGVWPELESGDQQRACLALGQLADPRAETFLATSLESSDPGLRCESALALAEGVFVRRLPDLLAALERAAESEEPERSEEVSVLVRAIVRIAEKAGPLGVGLDVQIIDALGERLHDASEPVRLAIAQVLARLGRGRDRDRVEYLLKDESPRVRRAAVSALGRFDFRDAQECLRLALSDESVVVRIAAARVLGESDEPEIDTELRRVLLDQDDRLVSVALRSLGRRLGRRGDFGGEAVEGIANRLSGTAPIALAATEALAEMGGPIAAQALVPALDREEPEVVRSAVNAIGQHGEEGLLELLLPLLGHPEWSVRADAARVFSERGFPTALPALLRRIDAEDDPFVREAVLEAIAHLEP